MKYLVLLTLWVLSSLLMGLSFEAEELQFTLSDSEWVMDGLFHFANYSDNATIETIFFPIPEDSLHLHPEIISLEAVQDSLVSCILNQQGANGFSFVLSMPAKHFSTVRIAYTQKLMGKNAKYIITTANAWNQPLRYASYKLVAAEDMKLTSLPFPGGEKTKNSYFWEFYEFKPEHEFEVGW